LLDLGDLAVDGAITTARCDGEIDGCSPVDRGKQGMKRSVLATAAESPLHLVAARANEHDSPLFEPTLPLAWKGGQELLMVLDGCAAGADGPDGYVLPAMRGLLEQIEGRDRPGPAAAGTHSRMRSRRGRRHRRPHPRHAPRRPPTGAAGGTVR